MHSTADDMRISDWNADWCPPAHPAIKLAGVVQQPALPRTVKQPRRCGKMTGQAPPFERILIIEHLDEHGGERRLVRAARGVGGQLGAQAVGFARGFHASSYVPAASEGRQA